MINEGIQYESVPSAASSEPPDGRAAQQKDNLCGPFHAARVLRDAGVTEWGGEPLDQDLVALRAGTLLPDRETAPAHPQVPAGAVSLLDYRYELPLAGPAESGTAAGALAEAIEELSAGRLACVPLSGDWTGEVVERLLHSAPALDARLLANVRTGALWNSRPPIEALLSELDGQQEADPPAPEWDVGHFVELVSLVRGRAGALAVLRDSYSSLGWSAHHLQPPRAVAAALMRGDGHDGGVLAVVGRARVRTTEQLAAELSLRNEIWDNGTRRE